MTIYYNEIDPFAAEWLRALIAAGHIAPGEVDGRSIEDVRPDDLRGFTQCHFFAGIGVWSHALRRAGWPDDRPVWTGSCPCQPFSAAGKGGGFDDERHLWPAFHWLIDQCRPDVIFGEQVASKDGLAWLDLVQVDLEGTGYAVGAVDTCAASFGAPHIRQRLYWVAYDDDDRRKARLWRRPVRPERDIEHGGSLIRLGHHHARLEGQRGGHQAEGGWIGAVRPVAEANELGGMADNQSLGGGAGLCGIEARGCGKSITSHNSSIYGRQPGPTNGRWRDADWLFCRDGRWRPVEPGAFPLAHGSAARVGRLRGYGNAIVAAQAQGFIEAYEEARHLRLTGASEMTNDEDIFS